MSAKRCPVCLVSYPTTAPDACPVCGEKTSWISNDTPTEDWQERVKQLVEQRERAAAVAEIPPRITGFITICMEHSGNMYVDQSELIRAGLTLRHDDTFRIFIANGWVWETQAWDEPRRRWLLERVYPAKLLEQDAKDAQPGLWVEEFIDQVLG